MKKVTLKAKTYFKSFDKNLCGRNGFQYTVGKVFEPNDENINDPWYWLYFSQYLSSTLIHGGMESPRICIVRPLGETWEEKPVLDGYGKGHNYSTNRLEIVRELSINDIFEVLKAEKTPFSLASKFNLTYDMLKYYYENGNKKNKAFREYILRRTDLSIEQKKRLIATSYYKLLQ